MAFIGGHYHVRFWRYRSYNKIENYIFRIAFGSPRGQWVNSLGPNNAIWCQTFWPTLFQARTCCLMATSHYLKQCWLIVNWTIENKFSEIWIEIVHEDDHPLLSNGVKCFEHNEMQSVGHVALAIISETTVPVPSPQLKSQQSFENQAPVDFIYECQGPISLTIFPSHFKFDGNFN